MNRTIARSLVLPLLSAGILGGAALGLAGTAAAAFTPPRFRISSVSPATRLTTFPAFPAAVVPSVSTCSTSTPTRL